MFKRILIGLAPLLVIAAGAVFLAQPSTEWTPGEVVRTPDSQFENLPDYNFEPNYTEVAGYRIHYVDEGPRDGEVILLMHGQPSWSYLYRHMIPLLSEAGYRVIAPDNVGFGKSDKPVDWSSHTYQMHVDVMTGFVDAIEIENATLFAQDWGGLIGLRVVEQRPDRFARIMMSNTTLPAAGGVQGWLGYPLFRLSVWGEGDVQELNFDDEDFSFATWVAYARTSDEFDFAVLFQNGTSRGMSEAELAGYAAPFPTEETMAGVRMFPSLVASQLRQNQTIIDEFYANWDKPLITAFGTDDAMMAGRDKQWQEQVPGAAGQAHSLIEGGEHFIQEDKPEELAELLDQFIRSN
ncbi:haloalkane dehalogenase [Erythrobacter sp. Alg231-14]|uniref:haloalkane dehalogenase n=1 Tax=Erythrobacter sp. Alg231-14 TaxID=1922225 RepID=UPI000D55E64F